MSDYAESKIYALFANPSSRKLITEMEKLKIEIKVFPPVEIEKNILNPHEKEILSNLKNYDWLIFQDVPAVDFFLENLEENAIDAFELDYLRICAIGETVADRLRFSAVHSDVITKTSVCETVLTEMIDYIGENELSELKILIPKSNLHDELPQQLKTKVAQITVLPIYTVKDSCGNLEATKLNVLLKSGAVDEFIFASPVDLIALKHRLKNENLLDILAEVEVSAVDSQTLQMLREQNLPRAGLFNVAKLGKVKP
jgi:uroporphyrinogen-III synthase